MDKWTSSISLNGYLYFLVKMILYNIIHWRINAIMNKVVIDSNFIKNNKM